MNDLLMIVPSRGRPGNIIELLDAWRGTFAEMNRTGLLVAVDDDDPELEGYRSVGNYADFDLVVSPRQRVGPTLNRLAVERAPDFFAVGFMGDDHRPRTQDWDERMVAALREMGSGIVYGNDLLQGERLPTAVVMTSDIIRALGYMVPPRLTHMYLDNFWLGLGRELGRIQYLPDVVIEHVHPLAGKSEWDDGYREVNSHEMYAQDRTRLLEWLEHDEAEALERVRAAIGERAHA